MPAADLHPTVIENYPKDELNCNCLVEVQSAAAVVHVSEVGVILKKHHPGKWRQIVDLSSPGGASINILLILACALSPMLQWRMQQPLFSKQATEPYWQSWISN
ncbi:MAG: hypothetical protein MJE68_04770 [Proteobacteria bacterium]|nr:hypothetical protein [Pseudomonadota bacterium]